MLKDLKKPKFHIGDKVYGRQWEMKPENELTVFDVYRNLNGSILYEFITDNGQTRMSMFQRQLVKIDPPKKSTYNRKYYHYKKKPHNYKRHLNDLPKNSNVEEAERIAQSNPQCALQMFDRKRG